jgi:pimeloyl-ACP methyl ester carboxylesterase
MTGYDRANILGVPLEYRWFGSGTVPSPAIVLLHEGLGSLAMWKTFPEQLAKATGHCVFAYSRQGYGGSGGPARREPDYMHVEARTFLPALLAAAGIERPILFGHSDGASIALLYAAAHPSDVAGLILEAPHVFVEPMTVDAIAATGPVFENTDMAAKLGRYHRDVDAVFWGWRDIWLDPRFRSWNIEAGLEAIGCPILMIQGLDDEYGSTAQLDAIVARVPGAEVLMLEACGHSPHRDQLARVIEASQTVVKSIVIPGGA